MIRGLVTRYWVNLIQCLQLKVIELGSPLFCLSLTWAHQVKSSQGLGRKAKPTFCWVSY